MKVRRALNSENPGNGSNWKKQLAWSLLFIVIAVASAWAITSQSRGFSLAAFREFVHGASLSWLGAAVLCMLIYIYAEGAALNCICASFSCRRRRRDGFVYASADIYFSAITPSATGGQPASAFFMIQDGIPGPTATVALLVNLCMYTLSIIIIGAFCFIVRPNIYASFSLAPRLLILLGCAVQLGLVVLFAMLLRHEKWVEKLGGGAIRLLSALHLVRHPEVRREKLKAQIRRYKQDAALVFGRWGMLAKALAFNILQRAAFITVAMFAYRAMGGRGAGMLDIWTVQGFAILGYNTIPIPGAIGVADYLILDGFRQLMDGATAVNLELVSRWLSFYSSIIICGITTLVQYIYRRRAGRDKR